MEGEGEMNEMESTLLQNDIDCIQDPLRALMQPTRIDDTRPKFYEMYQREATIYDAAYVKNHNDDLNTVLVFAGLLIATSTALIADTNTEPKPDADDDNDSDPSLEAALSAVFLYISLMASLFGALIAIQVKQWLKWYLRNASGSITDRCWVRQCWCDRFIKIQVFNETLPDLLHTSTFFLAIGLFARVEAIGKNVRIVYYVWLGSTLTTYAAATIFGLRSNGTPFRTPLSDLLLLIASLVQHLSQINQNRWNRHRQPQPIPLENIRMQRHKTWLKPEDLITIRRANTKDVQCVWWVLWRIINPEALDIGIRFAGTVRWFEGESVVPKPPYNLIVSTFKACFDPNRKLYPMLRGRAYCSARAILWIHILAMCVSEEFAFEFPLPTIPHDATSLGNDLKDLFQVYRGLGTPDTALAWVYDPPPQVTPTHLRWTWNALLHVSWAKQNTLGKDGPAGEHHTGGDWSAVPLDTVLNRFLTWCIFLGQPVEKAVLTIQDKSDYAEQIISELSRAIVSVIRAHNRRDLLSHILDDLSKWEQRHTWLTTAAYEWCSVICEGIRRLMDEQRLADEQRLLFLSLEIGFRQLDPKHSYKPAELAPTEYHQFIFDIVFQNEDEEAIADLLHAWTSHVDSHEPLPPFDMYAKHLVHLRPSSQRLRQLVTRAIGLIGYQGFEQVGTEGLFELLNHLHAGVGATEAGTATEDVQSVTLSLFHKHPGAIQEFKKWMKQRNERHGEAVSKSLQQVYEEARLETEQRVEP